MVKVNNYRDIQTYYLASKPNVLKTCSPQAYNRQLSERTTTNHSKPLTTALITSWKPNYIADGKQYWEKLSQPDLLLGF